MSQNGQMLQDFYSVSDHFGTLYIKGLKLMNSTRGRVPVDGRRKKALDSTFSKNRVGGFRGE